jgi:hypothetical protein
LDAARQRLGTKRESDNKVENRLSFYLKAVMTIHYHGTPITPNRVMLEMAGAHFCVSHAAPAQVKLCHEIGQSVMLDNGAFSVWKRGHEPDWSAYYEWCDRWLDYPTTWAVIPDVIVGDERDNDALLGSGRSGIGERQCGTCTKPSHRLELARQGIPARLHRLIGRICRGHVRQLAAAHGSGVARIDRLLGERRTFTC